MSEERPVLRVPKMGATETIGLTKAREIAENADELTDAELEARFAKVLERGIIVDRTTIDLPEDVYGEWVSDEAAEVSRMQLLGFEIDKKYAVERSTHSDGTGKTSKIGDVVFMTCPERIHQVIERVKKARYDRANPKAGSQREEKDFKQLMEKGKGVNIPVIDESVASEAGEADILAALEGNKQE